MRREALEEIEMKKGTIRRSKGTGGLQRESTGIYTIRAVINGHRVAKTTGTRDHGEALKKLEEFMAPFVRRDKLMALKMLEARVADVEKREEIEEENRSQMLLCNSWWYYIDSCRRRDVSESTLVSKKNVWGNFVNWIGLVYEENMEVRAVTPEIAEAYLLYLKRCVSSSTWNGRLCYLREIYRVVMDKAKAKSNPFDGIPLLPNDCHSRRELSPAEIRRLLAEAERRGDGWRTLVLTGLYTGLRLGDCCRLTWEKVSLEREIIQLVPSKTRRISPNRIVTIPIHPHLARIYQKLSVGRKGDDGDAGKTSGVGAEPNYILPEIGAMYVQSPHRVSFNLEKIFKSAGILMSVVVDGRRCKVPEATFHSLRHTFVSMAANAGIPLHVIQSIVGHESRAMTWHYYHEDERVLRDAIATIPSFEEAKK